MPIKLQPVVPTGVQRNTYQHEYDTNDALIADDKVPQTLLAMMRFVTEEYLPEITAHAEFANQWLTERPNLKEGTNGTDNPASRGIAGGRGLDSSGVTTFEWRGHEITTGVMPYRFWLLQHLHDDLPAAESSEQVRVRDVFQSAGLESLLDLRTLRRVERVKHLEVWGPLV